MPCRGQLSRAVDTPLPANSPSVRQLKRLQLARHSRTGAQRARPDTRVRPGLSIPRPWAGAIRRLRQPARGLTGYLAGGSDPGAHSRTGAVGQRTALTSRVGSAIGARRSARTMRCIRGGSGTGSQRREAGRAGEKPASLLPSIGVPAPALPALVAATAEPFVGREGELSALLGHFWKARSGSVEFVLIEGEAGIGKTRLAKAFASRAHAEGAAVLFGRCDEDPLTPYQPFIEALRGLAVGWSPRGSGVTAGPGADLLLQLVPELSPHLVEAGRGRRVEPATERYWLFETVATLLAEVGLEHPVVVVVEDLHWADRASLLLLRHLARSVIPSRLLLVSTCRDREVGSRGPLADTVADLHEGGVVHRVALTGLSDDESLALVAEVTHDQAQAVVVSAALQRVTKGNPFFLHQILRHLVETGTLEDAASGVELPVPAKVKEVIGRRLSRLGDAARRILTAAAVIGEEFDLDLLERVDDLSEDQLVAVVDELLASGVVAEVPAVKERYRFCHALVREVLYGRLSTSRRRLLHRGVASVLEELHGTEASALGQLARHFCQCAPIGDAGKAVDYATRAAERAMTQLAHEEAAEHYQRALAALDRMGSATSVSRCDLLLALGHALSAMGDVPRSIGVLTEAADLARSLADPGRLADAVLHLDWGSGPRDRVLVRMARDALEALGDGDPGLRAQLLSRLGMGLVNLDDVVGARAVAAQAVEAARAADDTVLLEALILQYYSLEGWTSIAARLALSSEIMAVARRAGSPLGLARASRCWMADLLQKGDMEGLDAQIEALASMDASWRVPRGRWLLVSARATRALLDGRFDDADRLATAALRIVPQWGPARAAFGLQLLLLRREQGRPSEAEALARNLAEEFPGFPLSRSLLVLALCDLDRQAEAREEFARLVDDDVEHVSQDMASLITLAALAETCAALVDRGRGERLHELLLPFADRNVALSTDGAAGAVSRYLGLLAATMGRFDDADQHFRRALEFNAAMGARPWIAHTQYDHARMLTDRGSSGDANTAAALLQAAHATATELGMALLAKRAGMLLRRVPPAAPATSAPRPTRAAGGFADAAGRSSMEVGEATFRREGEFWTVAHGHEIARFKDAKGLRYLSYLLSRPGQEVHVIDLVTSVQPARSSMPSPRPTAREDELVVEGEREELLDAHARSAYRQRLQDLGDELEEAERFHDLERVARAKREMDFLTDELARGLGLRGRARRASSSSERARASVTQCIKGVVRKITAAAPTLGRHLNIHVRTGTYCSYSPDPQHPIRWRS